ncbi:hypothetical protein BGZ73_004227 [Actinomortierella ambigua]|nr:hypothetical protein BGZ73_004227 [Actinomortierella ambigua]
MKSVRQKWASRKTSRRLQRCWQDYTSALDRSDAATVAQRLIAFLDAFFEAYQEQAASSDPDLTELSVDKLYGDCTDILGALFEAVEKNTFSGASEHMDCLQEAYCKSLVLIDLILKDEKYCTLTSSSPQFISRTLSMLERSGSVESKILILRIVATLGGSDQNKIEIARLEGYRKILRLLIDNNPELTQEIIRTVNFLLEFKGEGPSTESMGISIVGPMPKPSPSDTEPQRTLSDVSEEGKGTLVRSSFHLSRATTQPSSLPPRPRSFANPPKSTPLSTASPQRSTASSTPPKGGNYLRGIVGIDRVSNAISEVRGMFVQELGKIFPQLNDQDSLGIVGMGSDESSRSPMTRNYIPTHEQIQFAVAYYSQLLHPEGNSEQDSKTDEGTVKDQEESGTAAVAVDQCVSPKPGNERRASLKRMVSEPNLNEVKRPILPGRRKSEEWLKETSPLARGAAAEMAEEEEQTRKRLPANVLKEFMRSQGALRSLMSILDRTTLDPSERFLAPQEATGTLLATKIDIMETICKVLYQNSANQREFRALDGYTKLLKVFDEIRVPASGTDVTPAMSRKTSFSPDSPDTLMARSHSPAIGEARRRAETPASMDGRRNIPRSPGVRRALLLQSLSSVFFDLALDGSSRNMVQNIDAFHFHFRLLLEAKQLDVRLMTVRSIQDFATYNGINAVAAWRCGGIDRIVSLLRDVSKCHASDTTIHDLQWEIAKRIGLDISSGSDELAELRDISYFDGFLVSEDTAPLADMINDGSPVYKYLICLTRLLEYLSVLLVADIAYILYELSRLIMEFNIPENRSIVANILLRSVARITTDLLARGVPIEEKFVSIFLQIVRSCNQAPQQASCTDDTSPAGALQYTPLSESERELRDVVHMEQRMLALYILGNVVKGTPGSVEVFDMLQGYEVLTDIILPEKRACHHPPSSGTSAEQPATFAESLANPMLCQDCFRADIVAADLGVWLLRSFMLEDADNRSAVVSSLISLLKSTLSGIEEMRRQSSQSRPSYGHRPRTSMSLLPIPTQDQQQNQAHALLIYLYTKICNTVSLLLRESNEGKFRFGEAYGLQIILSVLSNAQHQDVATAALIAVGDFFAGVEGTAALVGESFGYDGFLELVLDSNRPLDKLCCEVVLEVATIGNVMSSQTRPHIETGNSVYCSEVWPFTAGLAEPHMLYPSALPFTCPRHAGSFLTAHINSHAGSDKLNSPAIASNSSHRSHSRPSSVYLDDNIDTTNHPSLHLPIALTPAVSSAASIKSWRSAGATPFQHHITSSSTSLVNGSNFHDTHPSSHHDTLSERPKSAASNRGSIFGLSGWANVIAPTISISSTTAPSDAQVSEASAMTASRRSSVQSQTSQLGVLIDTHPTTLISKSAPSVIAQPPNHDAKSPVTRKRSNSRNLGGFGLNTTNLGFQSIIPAERIAFKHLAGIVFRDADAARMTLRLLARVVECNNPKLASDYFNLMMLLMEVNPRNKELLSKNGGLYFMLQILFRRGRQQDGLGYGPVGYPYLPRPTDPPYVDLVPAMGAYDISVEDIQLLFDAVSDPLEMFIRLTTESHTSKALTVSGGIDTLSPLPKSGAYFDPLHSARRHFKTRPRSESAGAALTSYGGEESRKASQSMRLTSSASMGSFQYNPLFMAEMEQQMMYAIEKISERVDPPAYFNFNGQDACLTTYPGVVEKVLSVKGGYTLSLWVKVTAFLEKETGLVCYEEENGERTIFELYFKSLDLSNRYCLCVRTQHFPSPPEDFVFDRFDFAETGIWHHIVFVHNKTMKLIVDGCEVQSYGTFNQRRQDRDSALIGVLGRKGRHCMMSTTMPSPSLSDIAPRPQTSAASTSNVSHPSTVVGHAPSPPTPSQQKTQSSSADPGSPQKLSSSMGFFCGQTAKVYFTQGEWDYTTAEKVFNLGPASRESWKPYGIKSTVIAVLDPEMFKKDIEAQELQQGKPSQPSVRPFQSLATAEEVKIALPHGTLHGGCTIHMTRAMRDLIDQVGGIQLCFRFLEMSPNHLQLVGLRVISNLLYKSPKNIEQFQLEHDGYEVLFRCLHHAVQDLTVEHFGVLFDIATNGNIKDEHMVLSNTACLQLILKLLPDTVDDVQSYIMRTLVDLIVESPENMRLWRESFGMTTLFQLLRALPPHLRPFLTWTLESMMDGISVQEMGHLISFVGSPQDEPHLYEVRRDIIEMIYKRMTSDHALVDLLVTGLEGVTIAIGLLDTPSEQARVLILKMMGILLCANIKHGKVALAKPRLGIDLICETLQKYPLTIDVIQILIKLAQGAFRCDPNLRSVSPSLDRGTGTVASQHVRRSLEGSMLQSSASLASSPPASAGFVAGMSMQTLPAEPSEVSQPFVNASNNSAMQSASSISNGGFKPLKIHHVDTSDQGANGAFHASSPSSSSLSQVPVHGSHSSHLKQGATSEANRRPNRSGSLTSTGSGNAQGTGTSHSSGGGTSSGGQSKYSDELMYPEMIRLILDLIGALPHTDMVTHTLTDIKRIMTTENMRILWEAGWVPWVGAFLTAKAHVRVTSAAEHLSLNRALGVLDSIMQKMMIFDLSRKSSVTVRSKGALVTRDEDVGIQLRLTEAALTWFDRNPNLDTESAHLVCKSLVLLFRRVEELSRKFEERQRQAEKARLEALAMELALAEKKAKEDREARRLAMHASAVSLAGTLGSALEPSVKDDEEEVETGSALFNVEGDTDAEEVTSEGAFYAIENSRLGDAATVAGSGHHEDSGDSGATSPTGSTTSTLSLPLSTYSMAMARAANEGRALDEFRHRYVVTPPEQGSPGSVGGSRTGVEQPVGSGQALLSHQQQQRGRLLHGRPVRPDSLYSVGSSGTASPVGYASATNHGYRGSSPLDTLLLGATMDANTAVEGGQSGGGDGLPWPPLRLYEHFVACINNLACYNNSTIRAAMKSSGLFKIRDGLIQELGGDHLQQPQQQRQQQYGYDGSQDLSYQRLSLPLSTQSPANTPLAATQRSSFLGQALANQPLPSGYAFHQKSNSHHPQPRQRTVSAQYVMASHGRHGETSRLHPEGGYTSGIIASETTPSPPNSASTNKKSGSQIVNRARSLSAVLRPSLWSQGSSILGSPQSTTAGENEGHGRQSPQQQRQQLQQQRQQQQQQQQSPSNRQQQSSGSGSQSSANLGMLGLTSYV